MLPRKTDGVELLSSIQLQEKKNLVSECLTLAQEEDLTLLISSVLCNIHSPLNVPYKTLSNLIIYLSKGELAM